jgi:hypothetical protein
MYAAESVGDVIGARPDASPRPLNEADVADGSRREAMGREHRVEGWRHGGRLRVSINPPERAPPDAIRAGADDSPRVVAT